MFFWLLDDRKKFAMSTGTVLITGTVHVHPQLYIFFILSAIFLNFFIGMDSLLVEL